MTPDALTFWNVILPTLFIGGLAVVLPRVLTSAEVRSHRDLGVSVLLSAVALVIVSAMIAVVLNRDSFAFALNGGGPLLVAEIAVRSSALFAIAWLPLLLLSWFGLAQRVEENRGRDLARSVK